MKQYDPGSIEKKWQQQWLEEKIYEPDLDAAKRPFYNLMMFPYPSAEGLHVGNMYAFTGSDIYGRFKRMQGYDVFEPIGLDGFGIHSENYAMKIGKHPADQAKISEKRFYAQLRSIGNGFAWNERLATYDPEYYRWTQWLFVQMWRNGLAYRKKQAVNWCPSCKTVLADEQVENGKCERCGTVVEKKELEQWFLKITDYAERLLKNIDALDWSEKVKIAQKNWIGKSEGAEIRFNVVNDANVVMNQEKRSSITTLQHHNITTSASVMVFTTRPDTLFGATYLVLAPEHSLIQNTEFRIQNRKEVEQYVEKAKTKNNEERSAEGREKTGVELQGVKAVNPATGEAIPIWVADYVLGSYGTGAIMAVPAHDERDALFAKEFNIKQKFVIDPKESFESLHFGSPDTDGQAITQQTYTAWYELLKKEITRPAKYAYYTGNGYLIDSGKFSGMDSEKAKWEITKFVGGEKKTQFRVRDWLISRQRYWGPPIPMIFCEACAKNKKGERSEMPGWYAAPESDLPVVLPAVKDFRPTGSGVSPLAAVKSFYETECPACGGAARRETDVSDTFLDSAWYYLRYLSPENNKEPFDGKRVEKWLPAEMYIGGAEHAVLHLLYVRFVAMALHDWKMVNFEEPFKKFRAHGLVIKDGAKMSKSKGNVINPDEYIKNFGADTLRMYLMFLAPFEQGGDFRDGGILGVDRFLRRVWKLGEAYKMQNGEFSIQNAEEGNKEGESKKRKNANLSALVHKTVKKITDDIGSLHYNTAVSALMILCRAFEEEAPSHDDFAIFLKLLAPFAPHITEEIWRVTFDHDSSIHRAPWPSYDAALIKEETFTLVVQVNGKVKDVLSGVDAAIALDAVKKLALAREKVAAALGGKKPKKTIYIPGKIINIVTG